MFLVTVKIYFFDPKHGLLTQIAALLELCVRACKNCPGSTDKTLQFAHGYVFFVFFLIDIVISLRKLLLIDIIEAAG